MKDHVDIGAATGDQSVSTNPEHLYKYLTVEAAMSVIASKRFRWSSPLVFNDPFDCQTDLAVDLMGPDYPERYATRVLQLIESPTVTQFAKQTKLATLITELQQTFIASGSCNRAAIRQAAIEAAEVGRLKLSDAYSATLKLLKKIRLLCLSETRSSLLMWSHYADSHRGVVFGLRRAQDSDSFLRESRIVRYAAHIPRLMSTDEFVDATIGVTAVHMGSAIWNLLLCKSEEWSYEREWRVVYADKTAEDSLISDIEFDPSDLRMLILGCRINSDARSNLINAAKIAFPHIEVFQAKVSQTHYELVFSNSVAAGY